MDEHELRWRVIQDHPGEDRKVFRIDTRDAAHPTTGEVRHFSVIRCPDWVNVIALTPDDQVVLVRQHRHGTDALTLEIPGGMVDPGERPLEAARRELKEETGYLAERWVSLGSVDPNPALQTNTCHTLLALDARPLAAQDPDPGEVIAVSTRPLGEMSALIRGGQITHALVVAAFFLLLDRAGGWRRPTEDCA